MQAYLHPALHRQLGERARDHGRSISAEAAAILERELVGSVGAAGRKTPLEERVRELMRTGMREKTARRLAERERGLIA